MSNIQRLYVGASPNDGTGDPLRNAMIKVDDNFVYINNILNKYKMDLTNPASNSVFALKNGSLYNNFKAADVTVMGQYEIIDNSTNKQVTLSLSDFADETSLPDLPSNTKKLELAVNDTIRNSKTNVVLNSPTNTANNPIFIVGYDTNINDLDSKYVPLIQIKEDGSTQIKGNNIINSSGKITSEAMSDFLGNVSEDFNTLEKIEQRIKHIVVEVTDTNYKFTIKSPMNIWRINHNLNTTDLVVNIWENLGSELVEVDIMYKHEDANTVLIQFPYDTTGHVLIIK